VVGIAGDCHDTLSRRAVGLSVISSTLLTEKVHPRLASGTKPPGTPLALQTVQMRTAVALELG